MKASAEVKRSEKWVKQQVRELFINHGVPDPYMPPPAIYFGKKGAADFIECMYGHYIAIETKAERGVVTKMQQRFGDGVGARGGIWIVVRPRNLVRLQYLFATLKEKYERRQNQAVEESVPVQDRSVLPRIKARARGTSVRKAATPRGRVPHA